VTAALTIPHLRKQADLSAKHARNCKKPIDGCTICTAAIAWFRTIPPDVLSAVLQDNSKPVRG
jgi:hypothetical protein